MGGLDIDTADLSKLALKPRHVIALESWKRGYDARDYMSRSSFSRLRKELLEVAGYDIAEPRPNPKAVSLLDVMTLSPRPAWAAALTAAIERE